MPCSADTKIRTGPQKPRAIIANILADRNCKLYPKPRMLLELIVNSSEHQLSAYEAIPHVWPIRPAAIDKEAIRNLRTCASRVNSVIAVAGFELSVRRHKLEGTVWVYLEPL
jgi:hypothetical protein